MKCGELVMLLRKDSAIGKSRK